MPLYQGHMDQYRIIANGSGNEQVIICKVIGKEKKKEITLWSLSTTKWRRHRVVAAVATKKWQCAPTARRHGDAKHHRTEPSPEVATSIQARGKTAAVHLRQPGFAGDSGGGRRRPRHGGTGSTSALQPAPSRTSKASRSARRSR